MPIRWVTISLLLGIAIGANADTRKQRGHADRIAKPMLKRNGEFVPKEKFAEAAALVRDAGMERAA